MVDLDDRETERRGSTRKMGLALALLGAASIGGFGTFPLSIPGAPTNEPGPKSPVFDRTFDGDAVRAGEKKRRTKGKGKKARSKSLGWKGK